MKFLFTTLTSNDLGLLTRSLPIAQELAQRGHQVAFCNPALSPSRLIAAAGFDNLPLPHPLFYLQIDRKLNLRRLIHQLNAAPLHRAGGGRWRAWRALLRALPLRLPARTPEVWNMDHFAAMLGMLNANFVRANFQAFRALMETYAPDIVVDCWNPLACLAARVLQIPLVTVIQADLHPASPGFIWWKSPAPPIPRPTAIVNQILAHHARSAIQQIADLFVGDMTLVLGIPETDPLPAGAQVTYVGAILWQTAAPEFPPWWAALRPDRPVAWVYVGNPQYFPFHTPMDSADTLRACIRALAGEALQVVLTTGYHALPADVWPLPDNFHYAPFVPGLAMADRSALLIHHGGYGSCQTGLVTGTPMVIIPTYSERESNARRVAQAGAGAVVLPREHTSTTPPELADAIRQTVRQVLADPAYAHHARRISVKMRSYGGPVDAAQRIAALARRIT